IYSDVPEFLRTFQETTFAARSNGAMAREVTTRNPYQPDEPVYALPGQTPKPPTLPPERFRTGMEREDVRALFEDGEEHLSELEGWALIRKRGSASVWRRPSLASRVQSFGLRARSDSLDDACSSARGQCRPERRIRRLAEAYPSAAGLCLNRQP